MEKFYEDNCLYEQHYIKDEGTTIREMVASAIAKLGENISIKRFARFKVGEITGTSGPEAAPVPEPVKAWNWFERNSSAPVLGRGVFFGRALVIVRAEFATIPWIWMALSAQSL